MFRSLQIRGGADVLAASSIIDLMPFGIYIVDVGSFQILFINRRFPSVEDVPADATCYQRLYRLDHPCPSCQIPNLIDGTGRPTGKAIVSERFDDLDDCWYQWHEGTVETGNGRIAKYAIAVDIAETKRMQNELAEAHAELSLKSRQLERDAIETGRREQSLREAHEQLKAAQKQLVQAEKMASLGQLVAGIAHEMSTPVGVALNCTSLLTEKTEALRSSVQGATLRKSELEAYLGTVADVSELAQRNLSKAANLINRFKQISAVQNHSDRRLFELKPHLDDVTSSLGPYLREAGHRIEIDCPSGLKVDGYPSVLFEIFSHLVINSVIHGYPDNRPGLLSIAVTEVGAATVEIAYADDGVGISPDHQRQVFDPFFTTRRGGDNTGLGLHIVYNLVTNTLGRTIDLVSESGQGTRFHIRFPQSPVSALAPALCEAGTFRH